MSITFNDSRVIHRVGQQSAFFAKMKRKKYKAKTNNELKNKISRSSLFMMLHGQPRSMNKRI